MILNVIKAEYLTDYQLRLSFDNGKNVEVDLKQTIFKDKRKIFEPLRDINYFMDFSIKFNTVTWKNEADFAPEFLFELGQ
ncbi:MAG: DUF2442 domain-containing protein [Candidatus Kapabacteria bacterium]|nr:DUF2442 domain-containing protein [Candidatus Kapabacteria bacterium]